MAIIKCPECRKEISDKAINCPYYGYPLNGSTEFSSITVLEDSPSNNLSNEVLASNLAYPNFPSDLRIGQQITNWGFDSALKAIYSEQLSTLKGILPSGTADVLLHSHGLRIMIGLRIYDIHNLQIISIVKTSSAELSQVNKSVVGRAVLGGVILGPIGAIVGGISGIGTKSELVVNQYMAINYWDTNTRTPQTIILTCDNKQNVEGFTLRQKREDTINHSENRIAEQEHTPIWAIFCILVIIFSLLGALFL